MLFEKLGPFLRRIARGGAKKKAQGAIEGAEEEMKEGAKKVKEKVTP